VTAEKWHRQRWLWPAAEDRRVMNDEDGETIHLSCFPSLICVNFNYLIIVFNFQPSDLLLPYVFNL
jgi:hypothetical protein